jgi:hypothetical protein
MHNDVLNVLLCQYGGSICERCRVSNGGSGTASLEPQTLAVRWGDNSGAASLWPWQPYGAAATDEMGQWSGHGNEEDRPTDWCCRRSVERKRV